MFELMSSAVVAFIPITIERSKSHQVQRRLIPGRYLFCCCITTTAPSLFMSSALALVKPRYHFFSILILQCVILRRLWNTKPLSQQNVTISLIGSVILMFTLFVLHNQITIAVTNTSFARFTKETFRVASSYDGKKHFLYHSHHMQISLQK